MTVDLSVPDLAGLHQRRSAKWANVPKDVLSLTVAEMDFPIAEPIAAALRDAIDRDDLGYAPSDIGPLRSAFVEFARRRLNWNVDGERMIVMPDVVEGLISLCQLLGNGAEICFAEPYYTPFATALPRAGVRTRTIALLADGSLDLAALRVAFESGVRALVLASPHNPTGRVPPATELAAIAELCAEYEASVFSDEIHAPLVLDGASHTCWLEVSDAARECGVVLTSASKAFNLAGMKAAMIVTAEGRAGRFVEQLRDSHPHAGLFGVLSAEAAFAEGDAWLDAVLAVLTANRRQLIDDLARRLPAVRLVPPDATYLAWLDCRALGLGDDPAAAFLEHGRVALASGPSYGAPGAGYARLNFATSPEHLSEAVSRIVRAVELIA